MSKKAKRRNKSAAGLSPQAALIVAAVAVFLLGIGLYLNTLGHGFVFDDSTLIKQNPSLLDLNLWDLIGPHSYRPMRSLTYAFNYWVGGLDPFGYHLFNVILHALNGVLVLILVFQLAGRIWLAVPAAAIFVAHPVQTAAVAYISGRKDLLATFFLLVGLLLYLRFRRGSGKYRWMALSAAAFLLACLSKEVALVFPALVACLELLLAEQRGTFTGLRDFLRRHWAKLSLLFVLAFSLLLYALFWVPASRAPGFWGGSALTNYGTSLKLFAHYLKLILWPHPLIADYLGKVLSLSTGLLEPATLLCGVLLLTYMALAIWGWRKQPLLGFGLSWFGIAIAPVLQIIPFHELAADHFLYLPAVGFAIVAGIGFDWVLSRKDVRVLGGASLLAVVGMYSWLTVIRNPVWARPETLWAATYRDAPNSFRANCNLGIFAHQAKEPLKAVEFTEKCLELKPQDPLPYANLGAIKRDLGLQAIRRREFDHAEQLEKEALHYLQKAVELDPDNIWDLSNMGDAYRDLGLIYEARGDEETTKALRTRSFDYFLKALAIPGDHPVRPGIFYKMGAIFVDGQDYAGGIPFLKKAADTLPEFGQAQYVLGFSYYMVARQNPQAKAADWENARKYLERAMHLQPQADIAVYLADCYRSLGASQKAAQILQRGTELFPNAADIYYNLGLLYESQGLPALARQEYFKYLELAPDGPLSGDVRKRLGKN